MTNPQKRKGSDAERAVVEYLASLGVRAQRIPAGATDDRGDLFVPIIEWPSIDVKNYSSYAGQLSHWLDRANDQASNGGRRFGVVWFKRTRKTNPADWYVAMTGEAFTTLMAMIGDKP
jgi:hypothetical protein